MVAQGHRHKCARMVMYADIRQQCLWNEVWMRERVGLYGVCKAYSWCVGLALIPNITKVPTPPTRKLKRGV